MPLSLSHTTLTREVIRIAMMTDTVTVIVTHAYSNTRFVIVSVAAHDSGSDRPTVTVTSTVAVPPPNIFSREFP